jgi:two-component system, OmpR family, phosphate regulon response regulator PhoB
MLISATLALDELEVIEAADGDEAWRLMQAHQPDLAVLDVQMPGRTGLDLAQAIRQDQRLSGTYVILLTATAPESDVAAGLAAGADDYLTKPFSPLDLLEHVQKALREHDRYR